MPILLRRYSNRIGGEEMDRSRTLPVEGSGVMVFPMGDRIGPSTRISQSGNSTPSSNPEPHVDSSV